MSLGKDLAKSLVFGAMFSLQIIILAVSLRCHPAKGERRGVVVGLRDHAGMVHRVGEALAEATTVCVADNPYYTFGFDHDLSKLGPVLRRLVSPWLLGKLAASARAVVYIGEDGFLEWWPDGRAREFDALRRRGINVLCLFCGSDIRSFVRSAALGDELGLTVITALQRELNPSLASNGAEAARRRLARAADEHAHAVINPPVEQISYMEGPTHGFLYFYPDELIGRVPEKWNDLASIVVCHAPSSPTLKGTPLVRAAVQELRSEGYEFEYVELIGRSNGEVLAALRRAHVVLNEFYTFVPGVFGVEAMAANAALLTSADRRIEPSLPEGAEQAWIRTDYREIADHLRWALDHPESLQAQADRGTDWARRHCASSVCAAALERLIA